MSDSGMPGRASLVGRLLTIYALVFVVLIGLFGFVAHRVMSSALHAEAAASLARSAAAVALDLAGRPLGALPTLVDERAGALDVRVTVIDPSGLVLADSDTDPASMENHAARPEVVAALEGRVGVDTRSSGSTGKSSTYAAVLATDGHVVRLAITDEQLDRLTADVTFRIALMALLAGLLGILVAALVARRVARPMQALTSIAREVAAGRLDRRPSRYSVREFDRLGVSIGQMAGELGQRIEASESEREMLETLLDGLPQGVVLVAADGRVLYGNSTAREMVGEVPDRLSQFTPHALQRMTRQAMTSGEVQEAVVETTAAGPTVRAMASALPDGRALLVMSDITERVRVERMRRDFVADASHELKTPVASILAASETLQMALDRDPERARRFATLVQESALQLARIVGDLLDLSRVETSAGGTDPVRLDRVVHEEVERLRGVAAEREISLSFEVVPVTVTGSEADLGLAVRNLVSNAIRYSSPGDQVRIVMVDDGRSVTMSVEDTGVGIPRRSIPRVFERFYRVDVARSRETGGTGLGLAIVKHVAESHGGSVSVESELGVGSTFHLVLPVAVTRQVAAVD